MSSSRLGLVVTDENLSDAARELAPEVGAELVENPKLATPDNFDFLLTLNQDRLELSYLKMPQADPIWVDFVGGDVAHRRKFGGQSNSPLRKALGAVGAKPKIFDATAGLGKEAFLFASWGCQVLACEQSKVLYALLQDAYKRGQQDAEVALILEKLRFMNGRSQTVLALLPEGERPDVVYLDPMYPESKKDALPSKEMQFLRALLGEDKTSAHIFDAAMRCAKQRVVVKRPAWAPTVGPKPTATFEGKSTRYDMYLCKP